MSDYGKRVAFIDCHVQGIFNGNIGFVRYWWEAGHLCLGIYLQNLWEQNVAICRVICECGHKEEVFLTEIPILKGKGEGSCLIHKEEIPETDVLRLRMEWGEKRFGFCNITLPGHKEEGGQMLKEDKWEQLRAKYPCFYPFADQGCYVILQEAEWELLPGKCRNLWEKEFRTESYEKYHHMILGEYDIGGRKQFYLGLPGFYGEEEQRIAAEAGFIGYEFSGAAGYYLYPLGESI